MHLPARCQLPGYFHFVASRLNALNRAGRDTARRIRIAGVLSVVVLIELKICCTGIQSPVEERPLKTYLSVRAFERVKRCPRL